MSQFNKDTIMTVETMEDGRSKRTIRSFVLRQGRLTKGQEQAIDTLWPLYGINYSDSFLNWEAIYHNNNPVVLEIGFGMGASLVEMAKMNPHLNYLGIEVHLPGVGACLKSMKEAGVSNLRVINHDAVEVLNHQIPDNSLIGCQIFFPDPWHKAKHNKRRIIQPEFITLLRQKLSIGGIIHLATDWEDYAEQMLEVMNSNENMENLSPNNSFIPRPAERPLTKFEQRGINLGHKVWDLKHKRVL